MATGESMRDIEKRVAGLVAAYRTDLGWHAPDGPKHPRRFFFNLLREGVANRDHKAKAYARSIMDRVFIVEEGEDLDPGDRQRCLITILTTRAERFPLALHVFLGLLEGIAISEIHHIFFIVGTYTGIPGMVSGSDLLASVLDVLDHELGTRGTTAPQEVLGKLFRGLLEQFS